MKENKWGKYRMKENKWGKYREEDVNVYYHMIEAGWTCIAPPELNIGARQVRQVAFNRRPVLGRQWKAGQWAGRKETGNESCKKNQHLYLSYLSD